MNEQHIWLIVILVVIQLYNVECMSYPVKMQKSLNGDDWIASFVQGELTTMSIEL